MAEPVLTFEMALDSAPGAPTPTWTDLSVYLRQATTRRGRSRELERYMAGEAEFVLGNEDRRFDPMYAAGPYFGKILPMKRCRLTALYAAVTYPIFDGYVDSWEQVYEHPQEALAVVKATDAFKVLAAAELPSSVYALEVAADLPVAWWRLGEASGSTVAVNANGYQLYDLTYYGAPASTTGLVVREPGGAKEFTGSEYAQGAFAGVIGNTYTIEAWVKLSPVDVAPHTDDGSDWIYSQPGINFQVNHRSLGTLGQLTFSTGGVFVESSIRVDDNVAHHVVARRAAGTLSIWVDGVDRTSGAGAATGDVAMGVVNIGRNPATPVGWNAIYGVLDEVAIYEIALSDARIAAHNAAGRTPWTGDTPGGRAGKVLDYLAWPAGLRDIDTGRSTLQAASLGGSALEHLQKTAESEFGPLFVSRDGKITLVERDNLINLDSQATFGDLDPEWEYTALDFDYSDADLRNDVTVSRYEGTAQRVQDAISIGAYLRHSFTLDGLLHDDDALSLAAAQYLVALHKDPKLRVTQLRLEPVDGSNAALFAEALERELTEWVTVRRRPQNLGAAIDQVCVLEGIDHELSAKRWVTTFRLSPAPGPAGGGCFIEFDDGAGSAPCGFDEFAFAL